MSRINRTKAALEAAFRELLEERPLSKITVNSIVERCGVNRNTFYYYFEDIPSLLEQLIKSRTDEIIRTYSKFGSPLECITPVVQYGLEHKKALLHIYRSVQRDVFLPYLDRVSLYIVGQYVETVTADLFPPGRPSREKELLIRYYKCTLVGALLDWLNAGMEYDLLAGTASLCELLAGSGKQAFLKCVELQK